MELREVQTFLAVAQELHFGRAATRLRVSQGRVSQTIQALEREVGAALFERNSRRVRLTPLGERFHGGALRGFEELHRTLTDCRAYVRNSAGQLRVAYVPEIGHARLGEVAATFAQTHPHCDLTLNLTWINRFFDASLLLTEMEADVALVWAPGPDGKAAESEGLTVGEVLHSEGRGVVVPVGHPLTRYDAVRLDDLRPYELLRLPEAVDPGLRERWTPERTPDGQRLSYTREDLCELTGRADLPPEDILTLVRQGRALHLSVASLLQRLSYPGLALVPVVDLSDAVIVPVWRTTAESPAVRAFVEATTAAFSPADQGNRVR
ncbi:LysR family transcriptional regulator [Streptomyces sp. NPDC006739]|uniref:LysR family transcriptional regulator n=1 Tax=Streptomyces sp. NPDC006739 TaxID=3364763 RepID=UPI0036C5A5AB